LAGLAAVLSGASSVTGDLLSLVVDLESAESAATAPYVFVFLLYLLGTMLLLLGLVGLYASQSEAAGALGLVGFLVAFLGTALISGALWFELFITPSLATEAPELADAELGLVGFILSFLLVIVGWFLFGVATLRPYLPQVGCCASRSRGCSLLRPHTTVRHLPLRRGGMAGLRALHGKGYVE
jgi:hypothetical protein